MLGYAGHAALQVTGIVVSDRAGANSDNDNVLKDGIHFGVQEHLDNANQVRACVRGPCLDRRKPPDCASATRRCRTPFKCCRVQNHHTALHATRHAHKSAQLTRNSPLHCHPTPLARRLSYPRRELQQHSK